MYAVWEVLNEFRSSHLLHSAGVLDLFSSTSTIMVLLFASKHRHIMSVRTSTVYKYMYVREHYPLTKEHQVRTTVMWHENAFIYPWRLYVTHKRWYAPTSLHSVTARKTSLSIFTTMRSFYYILWKWISRFCCDLIEQSPPSEPDRCSAGQETLCPNVHCEVHKSQPLDPTLIHFNPTTTLHHITLSYYYPCLCLGLYVFSSLLFCCCCLCRLGETVSKLGHQRAYSSLRWF
jgi:hypothetical protein